MFRLLFTALRSAAYATGFVILWGWLALGTRSNFGELYLLPPGAPAYGIACMVIGGLVVLWCLAQFLVKGQGTAAPFDAPRHLVTSGPYRYVRNPMYYGAAFVLLGFGMLNRSTTIALFTVGFFILAHCFVVFYEEPALDRQFGDEYRAYQSKVNRWWPKAPANAS